MSTDPAVTRPSHHQAEEVPRARTGTSTWPRRPRSRTRTAPRLRHRVRTARDLADAALRLFHGYKDRTPAQRPNGRVGASGAQPGRGRWAAAGIPASPVPAGAPGGAPAGPPPPHRAPSPPPGPLSPAGTPHPCRDPSPPPGPLPPAGTPLPLSGPQGRPDPARMCSLHPGGPHEHRVSPARFGRSAGLPQSRGGRAARGVPARTGGDSHQTAGASVPGRGARTRAPWPPGRAALMTAPPRAFEGGPRPAPQ